MAPLYLQSSRGERDAGAAGRCPPGRARPEKSVGRRARLPQQPEQLPGQTKPASHKDGPAGNGTAMETTATFVGIDVAKAHLDLAVRPSGEQARLANDEAGI